MTALFWAGIGNSGRIGGTGDWATAANWTPAQVPAPGDLAICQGGQVVATNIGIVGQTVWLDSYLNPAVELSMIDSSFGPTSELITNSIFIPVGVELQNSALQGTVSAGSGQTGMTVDPNSAAVNYGWIGVAATAGATGLTVDDEGAFGNAGTVEVGSNGSFTLFFGAGPGGMANIWNTGDLTADPGGTFRLNATGATVTDTAYTGTLLNLGHVTANGGIVYINANMVQATTASAVVQNNGTLTLGGAVGGGTIQIESGMLAFGGNWEGPGPFASAYCNSTLAFTGGSAVLDFGETISAIDFVPSLNRLEVAFPWEGSDAYSASLTLAGSYTAADFTVSGRQVIYNAHPTS